MPVHPAPSGSRRALLASAAGVAATLAPSLRAQPAWPSRPITLIVPYTVGGASDIGARLFAPEMAKALGQPVVVENIAGAGGALGVQRLVRATPDGHTLLYGGMSESLLVPMINPSVGYSTKDLLPVAIAGAAPVALVVRSDFPANTVDELVQMARRNPGRLTFGSAGVGTFAHVMTEVVKRRTGTFIVHIPYRGAPQIVNDVVAGQIDLAVTTTTSVVQLVAARRVKVLGVSAAQRIPAMADVPTFGESKSLAGVEMRIWAFVFAPQGTPAPVVARLNEVTNAAVGSPTIRATIAKLAAETPSPLTPEQCRTFIDEQVRLYEPVTRDIKPE